MTKTTRMRMDLLAFKPVRRVLMSPAFPVALQVMALVGVLGLALNGLAIGADMNANDLMTLRKTNLTTLVAWGLWWPAMIAVALAFGRA